MTSDQSARDAAAAAQTATPRAGAAPQYVPRQAASPAAETTGWRAGAATGLTLAAAVLMMISGIWNFLEGLAAVIKGSFFIVLPNYAYNISITGWGWFHLILGVVVAAAGAALLTGHMWARVAALILVSVSAIVNFLYIPYQPVWSVVLIAIDAAVIWALLARRADYA
jgi:hypothetical protein